MANGLGVSPQVLPKVPPSLRPQAVRPGCSYRDPVADPAYSAGPQAVRPGCNYRDPVADPAYSAGPQAVRPGCNHRDPAEGPVHLTGRSEWERGRDRLGAVNDPRDLIALRSLTGRVGNRFGDLPASVGKRPTRLLPVSGRVPQAAIP